MVRKMNVETTYTPTTRPNLQVHAGSMPIDFSDYGNLTILSPSHALKRMYAIATTGRQQGRSRFMSVPVLQTAPVLGSECQDHYICSKTNLVWSYQN